MKNTRANSTPGRYEQGYFEYFSFLLCLNRYQIEHKEWLESCFHNSIGPEHPKFLDAVEIRALLMHEATHFLDLTTTAWGHEYTVRKALLMDKIRSGQPCHRQLSVFRLNTAEIEVHRALLEASKTSLEGCELQHCLRTDETYGPHIAIVYSHSQTIKHVVPLSMLAVIEGHATANEVIRKILDISRLDTIPRRISMSQIEDEFDKHLFDPAMTEYTSLLYLLRIHFRDFTLLELLQAFSAIARFSLDIDSLDMAMLADFVGFAPTSSGTVLAMDMRRGSSRAVICFKTILFIYEWIQDNPRQEASRLALFKGTPSSAIQESWEARGMKFLGAFAKNIEFQASITTLKSLEAYPDHEIISQSMQHNSKKLLQSAAGTYEFSDLCLLDFMLTEDMTCVTAPLSMTPAASDLFENHYDIVSKVNAIYRDSSDAKFFMPIQNIQGALYL